MIFLLYNFDNQNFDFDFTRVIYLFLFFHLSFNMILIMDLEVIFVGFTSSARNADFVGFSSEKERS